MYTIVLCKKIGVLGNSLNFGDVFFAHYTKTQMNENKRLNVFFLLKPLDGNVVLLFQRSLLNKRYMFLKFEVLKTVFSKTMVDRAN